MWRKELGVEVQVEYLDPSGYAQSARQQHGQIVLYDWCADYPDPENFLFPLFHSSNHGPAGNRTRYTNATVDALIEKGQYTMGEKTRNTLYQKAEELIVNDAPWVFLWHKTDFTIRQPWVENYTIYPIYSMDKGLDIEIK
jgi:peptide/nickel transport system substrate-binding protein/oligopeptide transport system substrate-binding protein